MPSPRPLLLALCLAPVIFLLGCDDKPKVVTYSVPKETSTPAQSPVAISSAPETTASSSATMSGTGLPQISSAASAQFSPGPVPAHWRADTDKPMRKGSWSIPGPDGSTAEWSITAFPGDVGGDLANVNRWRNQIQLGPISAAELPAVLQPVTIGNLPAKAVLLNGPTQTVYGVILLRGPESWFFKFTGTAATFSAEKTHLQKFVEGTTLVD